MDGHTLLRLVLPIGAKRRGAPRAYRAWPLAWPSPSGPLGRQRLRRSRVGPGVPVHVVAARLGHADTSITLRVYAHVISNQLTEAARAAAATS